MLKRILGKSKLEVSALGMGCWAIGGPWDWAQPGEEPFPAGWGNTDDNESIRGLHAAFDMGATSSIRQRTMEPVTVKCWWDVLSRANAIR